MHGVCRARSRSSRQDCTSRSHNVVGTVTVFVATLAPRGGLSWAFAGCLQKDRQARVADISVVRFLLGDPMGTSLTNIKSSPPTK